MIMVRDASVLIAGRMSGWKGVLIRKRGRRSLEASEAGDDVGR